MRNVFDQYSQPENKLTHALMSTLHEDRSLLVPFLRWVEAPNIPKKSTIRLVEQQVPGTMVTELSEEESKGLPDGCFYTDEGWAYLIESKVQASISPQQLRAHLRTSESHGFECASLLVLSVDTPPKNLPDRCSHRYWRDVYRWFSDQAKKSKWAKRFAHYMETLESQMVASNYDVRGTLTMFNGLKFGEDQPYTYQEAKRLIRLMGDELSKRSDLIEIGMDPKGNRRPSIQNEKDRVWDYLPLKLAAGSKTHTNYPHFTMSLHDDRAVAALTVPNSVKGGLKTKLKAVGLEGFCEIMWNIEKETRSVRKQSKDSYIVAYALQRHYRSQRGPIYEHARLETNLLTAIDTGKHDVKYQMTWVNAIYDALVNKNKKANIQFGVEVRFKYDCQVIQSPKAVDLFAKSWIGMKPLLDFVLEGN